MQFKKLSTLAYIAFNLLCSQTYAALSINGVYTYDENTENATLLAIPGAYADDASDQDLINSGQPSLASSPTLLPTPNFGTATLNDGLACTPDTTNGAFYANTKFPASATFFLDTSTHSLGYTITSIQSIAGWTRNGANLGNQRYQLWIRTVGTTDFSLVDTIEYIPFVSNGLDSPSSASGTRVNVTDDSGTIATGVDAVRFVFLDEGQNFGALDGTVYQEFDVTGEPTPSTFSVHPLFQDNAVLQRDINLPIWGTAAIGNEVIVKLDGQTVATTTADANGNWSTTMGSYSGDGGQTHNLEVSTTGSSSKMINNVVFGDVYIAAGQSNMQRAMSQTTTPNQEAAIANFPLIREVKVSLGGSAVELSTPTLDTGWVVCSPATARTFSGMGYYFAKELHLGSNEPVGILRAAWGGQPIERFFSAEGLASVPHLSAVLQNEEIDDSIEYFDVYNFMIAPLSPYAIRGVVWYQGENNAGVPEDRDIYQAKLRALARGWRNKWDQGNFPFHIVQLPNFGAGNTWEELREAQLSSLTEPNFNLAVTIDVGEDADIHPRNKRDPGYRVAQLALARDLKQNISYSSPLLHSSQIEDSQIRVFFDHAENGLFVGTKNTIQPVVEVNGPLQNFEIAGSNRIFVDATAVIDGDTVVVSSASVPLPHYVRYCYSNAPSGANKLYNSAGLPASPFTTLKVFELDVLSGTGDGINLIPGTSITINADAPASGYVFDRWIGPAGVIANVNSADTDVTIPEHDLYVLATYRPNGAPTYTVTVTGGAGSGASQTGSVINIKADIPAPNQVFDQWTGDTSGLANPEASETTLRMPAENISLTATYRPIDSIGDTIPDTWRALHFGGDGSTTSTNSLASADPDGDGDNNLKEYRSGSNPNDPTSSFKTVNYIIGAEVTELSFKAFNDRRFSVMRSDSLNTVTWVPAIETIAGDGLMKTITIETGNSNQGFFRIESMLDLSPTPSGLGSN